MKTGALLSALVAALAAAGEARAQIIIHEGDRYRSPQRFALELRFGPYAPQIDDDVAGATPHMDYFGDGPAFMTQVELDYQFFDRFGTLAIGAGVGYMRQSARAFVEPPPGQAPEARSGDRTRLTLVPTSLLLVYRFDVLADRWQIPLVPYAKAGLGYTFWSITDGDGRVARTDDGERGRGGTFGWQAAAGLAFLLDFIDPGAARELDGEIGVNHTYLFVEGGRFDISGLGQSNALRLDDTTWFAGLAFEF